MRQEDVVDGLEVVCYHMWEVEDWEWEGIKEGVRVYIMELGKEL